MRRQILILFLLPLLSYADAPQVPYENFNGRAIMEEVYRRHQQYPYVYEQQSMVMRDRNGKRDTRKAHRYSRVEEDGTARFLLVFDFPNEIKGVAVLASRSPDGSMSKSIYLPAYGEQLIASNSDNAYGNFLGTDFTVENIVGEVLDDYLYERKQDRSMGGLLHFVLDVYTTGSDVSAGPPVRRHYIRQDNFFITMSEHLDGYGRLHKRQSYHDLRAVDGEMWRSGMILMEDIKEQHQSLLKVTRRLFSHDYVPPEMFTAEWLFENHPHMPADAGPEASDPDDGSVAPENDFSVSLDSELTAR